MNLVDSKYIGLVSPRLQKFKKVKNNLFNFRCPICGDSKKNKSKTRGYFYTIKADVNFRCHNCGASMTFSNFLKEIDTVLHKQYVFERFKDGKSGRGTVVEEPKFNFQPPEFKQKIDLPKADSNERAKEYLERRKLNPSDFYYTSKFKAWTNSHKKTFDDFNYDEPRIIIPLFYKKSWIGFQGRSLGPNSVKYITVIFNENSPKIYGLDNIRTDAPVFVTEGPFDSTFIRNSIAMCGADGDVGKWGVSTPVWVYDNEPRSKEITSRISNNITNGESVVIWPNQIKEKDINDMVLAGHDVQSIVESNIYNGLEAKLQFTNWKRI
jgi:transcription elongation factor Elf1|tara:strand:- start:686 stop:1654 length:969 start_codon:yes stop_codon:yes gene_type:complete